MTKWVDIHMEAMSGHKVGGVIQQTEEFVELLNQAAHELTPADHAVVEFLRKLGVNCYDVASRKMDDKVFMKPVTCMK